MSPDHSPVRRTATGRVDGRVLRREASRRRIVAAARDLFAERGYNGTPLEEIASAAGVSKGTIFYNFENKAALFEEIVQAAVDEIVTLVDAAREGRRGWEALSQAVLTTLTAVDRSPATARIVLSELFRQDSPGFDAMVAARARLVRPLVEIMDEMAADLAAVRAPVALVAPDDRGQVALAVVGALTTAAMDRMVFAPDRPIDRTQAALMAAMSGLSAPPSRQPQG